MDRDLEGNLEGTWRGFGGDLSFWHAGIKELGSVGSAWATTRGLDLLPNPLGIYVVGVGVGVGVGAGVGRRVEPSLGSQAQGTINT